MILNYNDTARKFTVTFVAPPETRYRLKSCLVGGDPTTPEKPEGDPLEPGKPHSFEVPGGTIFGFAADDEVVFSIEEPDQKMILVLTATGKNPWPTPPPDAPSKYGAKDFAVRFENFNRGTGGGADPHIIRYRLEPASAAASGGTGGCEKSA
jgi:hypothetical protein